MEIRPLLASDDRFAVSRVYEESWKYAYQGILPQDFLDSIPAGRWAAGVDKADVHTLVMLEQGNIIGTSSFSDSRFSHMFLDTEDYGEIISIYLLPAYIGKGYGKKLINAVLCQLSEMGFQNAFLWVLEENSRARRFYESCGFYQGSDYLDDNIGGKTVREIQYRCRIQRAAEKLLG